MKDIEITKLKIRLAERTIELTPAEARALHRELAELFGEAHPHSGIYERPIILPAIVYQRPDHWRPAWEITWCSSVPATTSADRRGMLTINAGTPGDPS